VSAAWKQFSKCTRNPRRVADAVFNGRIVAISGVVNLKVSMPMITATKITVVRRLLRQMFRQAN
jgi:hypothetical protein